MESLEFEGKFLGTKHSHCRPPLVFETSERLHLYFFIKLGVVFEGKQNTSRLGTFDLIDRKSKTRSTKEGVHVHAAITD